MPTGKEVSGYRGHSRPAWASWHPEALITVGAGPPAHLEEGLQTAHPGPFVGCRHRAPHPVPPLPQSLRHGVCVSEGLPAQRSRQAEDSRGHVTWLPRYPRAYRRLDAPAARSPARPPLCFPARASQFPSQAPGQAQPRLQHREQSPSEQKWGTARVSPGPRAGRLQGTECGLLLSWCGPGDVCLSARQLPLLQIQSVSFPGHVYVKCPGPHLSTIGAQK